MASSSEASIQKSFKYDVFLSFGRGDTHMEFVNHLYSALQKRSIHTYKEDERIKKGKKISNELINLIQDSKFYIIVFSKSYVSSSWCLDELVKIMECQKTSEQTAYPVFYDVDPTEVGKQSGAVGKAFARLNKEEGAAKWREALNEAAGFTGWELKNTTKGHEAKFIREIAEEVSLELRSISYFDKNLVGMKKRIKEISSMEIGSDDVRMIGIWGIAGAGKTTLARALFNHISIEFEAKSFVENVREVSESSLSGLHKLQEHVLSDVFNERIHLSGVRDGIYLMRKIMCRRKVLLVLDDVDNRDQLKFLAGNPNWFKSGSRIIITTRNEEVLMAHGVSMIHDVNLLSYEEAICLFSRHAFGKEIPIEGYEELSGLAVRYADGLPLIIKVLGSFLCGKDELEWKDALERLKTTPLRETLEILKLYYNSLEEDYKEIFLEVACMLKGRGKEEAIIALRSCGFYAENGLRVLELRSLISVSKDGKLEMHDHIEEMGKNIVRHLHPNKPHKHRRLWIHKEIEDILVNDMGTTATECIKLQTDEDGVEFLVKSLREGNMKEPRYLDPQVLVKGLRYMKRLRFLHVDSYPRITPSESSHWKDDEESFPDSLRYLEWNGYPFRSLPKTFQPSNLVGLIMARSKIVQLWDDGEGKVLFKLRFLELNACIDLRTLDLRLAPNLRELCLSSCADLVELLMPTKSLKLISIKVNSLNKLRILDIGITPNLEKLTVNNCNDLAELRLEMTPKLMELSLQDCHNLVELLIPPDCLHLIVLRISLSKLRTLDLGLTPYLERLYLVNCCDLVEVNAPVGCLERLVSLEIKGCGLFKYFSIDRQHRALEVCSLSELLMIEDHKKIYCRYKEDPASTFGNLESLISVGLCPGTKINSLVESICGLQCLRKLELEGNISEGPKDLDKLKCLEELNFYSTKIKNLPGRICMLKHLKSLKLVACFLLEMLPEDIGLLDCLERLILTECTLLREIPDSICEMKRLEYLELICCTRVAKLPEELGRLECLKVLNIKGTGIRILPPSIIGLKGLHIAMNNTGSQSESL